MFTKNNCQKVLDNIHSNETSMAMIKSELTGMCYVSMLILNLFLSFRSPTEVKWIRSGIVFGNAWACLLSISNPFFLHEVKSLFSEVKWTGAQYYAEPGLFLRRSPDTWHTFSQEHHYPWIYLLLYPTYFLFCIGTVSAKNTNTPDSTCY